MSIASCAETVISLTNASRPAPVLVSENVEDALLKIFQRYHAVRNFKDFEILTNKMLEQLGHLFHLKQILFCRFNPIFNEIRQISLWNASTSVDSNADKILETFRNLIDAQQSSRLIHTFFNELLESSIITTDAKAELYPIDLNKGHGGFLYTEFFSDDQEMDYKNAKLTLFVEFLALAITHIESDLTVEWSTDFYLDLMEHALTAILIIDLDKQKVVHANRHFTHLTYYPPKEADTFLNNLIKSRHLDSSINNTSMDDLTPILNGHLTVTVKSHQQRRIFMSTYPIPGSLYHIMTFVDLSDLTETEIKLTDSLDKMQKTLDSTLDAISHLTDYVDPYTSLHHTRTADLALHIAKALNLNEVQQNTLKNAAKLHDVGKILLPPEIINKPGRYSPVEATLVKTHVKFGFELIKDIDLKAPVADIILQHHERLDGSGYPLGLKEQDLLLESMILTVADIADNLLSHRPYRPAYSIVHTIELLERDALQGRLYPPAVHQCIEILLSERWKP